MNNLVCKDVIVKIIENNNPSNLEFWQFIFTIVFSFVTFWVALLTYKLQRQANKISEDKDKRERRESANNISWYIEDTIKKCARNSFKNNEMNDIFISKKEYMKDLLYLRGNVLNEIEYRFLFEVFIQIDNFNDSNKSILHKIKPLYKLLIDNNFSGNKIEELNRENMIYEIANVMLLVIMIKLNFYLQDEKNNNLIYESNILKIHGKDYLNFKIEKKYEDSYLITYENGNIFGNIRKYEPIFFGSGINCTIEFEEIYNGHINFNKFDGIGKYEYYSQNFGKKLNSSGLVEKGVNEDLNAIFIADFLTKNGVSKDSLATFEGIFKEGIIFEGKLLVFYDNRDLNKMKEFEI